MVTRTAGNTRQQHVLFANRKSKIQLTWSLLTDIYDTRSKNMTDTRALQHEGMLILADSAFKLAQRPAMQRNSVDLPEPDGPNNPVIPREGRGIIDCFKLSRRMGLPEG